MTDFNVRVGEVSGIAARASKCCVSNSGPQKWLCLHGSHPCYFWRSCVDAFAANGRNEPFVVVQNSCCLRSQRGKCCVGVESGAAERRKNKPFMLSEA